MAIKAQTTVVTLQAEDLIEMQQILMDGDQQEALTFLRDVIGEKIRCAQTETHRPEFEGGVQMQETHKRATGAGHPVEDESG
ncbi:MAG: hypothetical protein ABSD48_14090 [Armatimonadota bacterium]|jgi:hypothetical protein